MFFDSNSRPFFTSLKSGEFPARLLTAARTFWATELFPRIGFDASYFFHSLRLRSWKLRVRIRGNDRAFFKVECVAYLEIRSLMSMNFDLNAEEIIQDTISMTTPDFDHLTPQLIRWKCVQSKAANRDAALMRQGWSTLTLPIKAHALAIRVWRGRTTCIALEPVCLTFVLTVAWRSVLTLWNTLCPLDLSSVYHQGERENSAVINSSRTYRTKRSPQNDITPIFASGFALSS